MMLQVVASLTIAIVITVELSFTLLKNTYTYNTGVTHGNRHMMIAIYL